MEWVILLVLSTAEHHRTLAGTIFRPTDVRRLSWPGRLVTYRGSIPTRTGSNRPIVRRPGIELSDTLLSHDRV